MPRRCAVGRGSRLSAAHRQWSGCYAFGLGRPFPSSLDSRRGVPQSTAGPLRSYRLVEHRPRLAWCIRHDSTRPRRHCRLAICSGSAVGPRGLGMGFPQDSTDVNGIGGWSPIVLPASSCGGPSGRTGADSRVARIRWPTRRADELGVTSRGSNLGYTSGRSMRSAGDLAAKAGMIELRLQRSQTGFDIAQAFAVGPLCEGHREKLIAAGEFPHASVAAIASNARVEVVPRKEIHQPSKPHLAGIHVPSFPTKRWVQDAMNRRGR